MNPDLVVRDKEGKPYSVRYDQVNAMLLNEFLKEHRKIEEQEATLRASKSKLKRLLQGLQKVSAQLEVSKPAPQTASEQSISRRVADPFASVASLAAQAICLDRPANFFKLDVAKRI